MLPRKYCLYSIKLLNVLVDLATLIIYISLWPRIRGLDYIPAIKSTLYVSQCSLLCLSILDGIYMSTYGFFNTNTIHGSFVSQQLIAIVLVGPGSALLIITRQMTRIGASFAQLWYSYFTVGAVGLGLHALGSIILWCLFLTACLTKDPLLGRWTTNVEDLATGSGAGVSPGRISWRGTKRPGIDKRSRWGCAVKPINTFILNALFRRIPEVETISYAFVQHSFALAAIALLLTRIVTLSTQLGNEDLPSRTVVGDCSFWEVSSRSPKRIVIVVRYPELTNIANSTSLESVELAHQVSIGYQGNKPTNMYNSTVLPCDVTLTQKAYDHSSSTGLVDWFHVYDCSNLSPLIWLPVGQTGFIQYAIRAANQTTSINIDLYKTELPSLWLAASGLLQESYMLVPYLIPPIQPVPNTHTYFRTRYAQRRFISSSAFKDAVTGSKPTYEEHDLYLWSQVYTQQLSLPNISEAGPHTTGFIRTPDLGSFALQTPRSKLITGARGPDELCEITEEYRAGSAFDILASIGGLLALLQGLHVFLFGRPLFWGLFGAKPIAPFGLFGRLATKGFRKRLRDYYYPSDSLEFPPANQVDKQENIFITRFLLDYVIDLGPAELPVQETKDVHSNMSREQYASFAESEVPLIDMRAGQAKRSVM